MSTNPIPSGIQPKEKAGSPEGCRQDQTQMDTVMEARTAGNSGGEFRTPSERKKLGIWLDDLVSRSKEKPIAQMVKLTPTLAEVLLDRNPANRRINVKTVEAFAREISAKRWEFNGEPIIVANSGELNDGQHRCAGVVMAGKPIEVILIVGVERETRMTLDRGRARTIGDYLSMAGHAYSNALGASAAFVWQHRNRGLLASGSSDRATKSEILETVEANPGIERSVGIVSTSSAAAVGGNTMLGFVHFTLTCINREDADHFIHQLMTGAGVKAGDPVLYVRNRLIRERGQLKANDKAELIFKGWNAWRRGERITTLRLVGGELPQLER